MLKDSIPVLILSEFGGRGWLYDMVWNGGMCAATLNFQEEFFTNFCATFLAPLILVKLRGK